MANQPSAEQGLLLVQAVVNSPPEARTSAWLLAKALRSASRLPASDPDGDAVSIAAASTGERPESTSSPMHADLRPGSARLAALHLRVSDGRGGTDTGQVTAFVNSAEGELDRPVLQGLDDQQLARRARACASGQALEVETAGGTVDHGAGACAGRTHRGARATRAADPPASGEFISATYLIAEGGLLVLTEDGRMVYVADLVDAANSAQPPTLRVAGGPGVGSDVLLTNLQPLAQLAEGDVVGRLPSPQSRPEHWGGANFNPYDPGAIAAGPFPLGPLLPTALGLGTPPMLEIEGCSTTRDGGGPGPWCRRRPRTCRRLFGATSISARVGRYHGHPAFASAGRSRAQRGCASPDGQINGVDQANLTLGQSGDATIVFGSEFAAFVSTLGVF